jgi:hypothetical protein
MSTTSAATARDGHPTAHPAPSTSKAASFLIVFLRYILSFGAYGYNRRAREIKEAAAVNHVDKRFGECDRLIRFGDAQLRARSRAYPSRAAQKHCAVKRVKLYWLCYTKSIILVSWY